MELSVHIFNAYPIISDYAQNLFLKRKKLTDRIDAG